MKQLCTSKQSEFWFDFKRKYVNLFQAGKYDTFLRLFEIRMKIPPEILSTLLFMYPSSTLKVLTKIA